MKNISPTTPEAWLEMLCQALQGINSFKENLRDSMDGYMPTNDLDEAVTLIEKTMQYIDEELQPDGADVLSERCDQL